jgi:hypothetical protein
MSIETTRAYVTMNSIDNKITAAVAAEKVILRKVKSNETTTTHR